jgi:hypothetical protein
MPYEKSNKEIQESKVKGFKMKGSPMKRNFGIGADSPMKQDKTTPTYSGVTFNPMSSYDYKASPDIPSFRDIVSLEQQQAYADKVDKRRDETKTIKEGGGGTYREYKKEQKDLGLKDKLSRKDWREQNYENFKPEEVGSGDDWDYNVDNKETETSTTKTPNEFPKTEES